MMQDDEKVRGLRQGNVFRACRERVKADESCLNLYKGVSEPMGGGRATGERVTPGDSSLRER